MGIAEGVKDWGPIWRAHFNSTKINLEDHPHRFQPGQPEGPLTIQASLNYIDALCRITPNGEEARNYILAFAAGSESLRALDEAKVPIMPYNYPDLNYPVIIASLAGKLTIGDNFDYSGRENFLLTHLGDSVTLEYNLDVYGYQGLSAGEPNAAWAIRRAFSAVGGIPNGMVPQKTRDFAKALSRVFPEYAEPIAAMLHDYRCVPPPSLHHGIK